MCCGRRWGKTQLGVDRVIHGALKGRPAGWFAPSYKQTALVWRELLNRLEPVVREVNQQDRRIELIGGGSVDVWSLDSPDAGRGRAYGLVVLDEAAHIPDLEEAWMQNIRPMLTDYRGEAWFLSTPKGTGNFFYTLYNRGNDPEWDDWAAWRMPSATNPYLPADEIEVQRRDMTELAFEQESLAQFVTWAGAVFRGITSCVVTLSALPAVIIGVDWGRTNDYTVFTGLDQTGRVTGIDRFRGIEYELQRGRLAAFWSRMGGKSYIVAEVNNMGGPVVEQIYRDGLPVVGWETTSVSKMRAMENLALAFERGAIGIPDDPVLIGELQAFEGKKLPSGMTRYAAPQGQHDDMVMSLAIAWAGLRAAEDRAKRVFYDPWQNQISQEPPERFEISPI